MCVCFVSVCVCTVCVYKYCMCCSVFSVCICMHVVKRCEHMSENIVLCKWSGSKCRDFGVGVFLRLGLNLCVRQGWHLVCWPCRNVTANESTWQPA